MTAFPMFLRGKINYSLVGKYVEMTYRILLQQHIRFMTCVIGVHPKRD
jgi:hypothetical protein